MTPTSGDVVDLDLGLPQGREAGFNHPAIIVTAQRILDAGPSVVHVVPLTTRIRGFATDITLQPDSHNGLAGVSAAQCQHVRAISADRITATRGNAGPAILFQIRDALALVLDIP